MGAREIREAGNRPAVLLENRSFRTVISDIRGMIPELSTRTGGGWLNSHWQPWFRANSGEPWNEARHGAFWGAPLLYDIAGSFPCAPNFGPGHDFDGHSLPPHGFTAFGTWEREGMEETDDYVLAVSTLASKGHPFRYRKWDLVPADENVLYTRLEITNTGGKPEKYNCGWHNTVGSPFLEKGCLIDNNARGFAVPPGGGEFDATGRLLMDGRAESLQAVPCRDGSTADLRQVPGIIGYSDFITGALPPDTVLGWSSVVNPRQKALYLAFFPGPSGAGEGEIPLYFCDLWMNYGGRSYTPWATGEGLTDQTFCLGTENATGYFANGLKAASAAGRLLGNPVYLVLPPGESRTLYYGTLFQTWEGEALTEGLRKVSPREGSLLLEGRSGKSLEVKADAGFALLRQLA